MFLLSVHCTLVWWSGLAIATRNVEKLIQGGLPTSLT